jgi:hypothetical protein
MGAKQRFCEALMAKYGKPGTDRPKVFFPRLDRFIDRHMRPGEKRPPAPSVRRDTGARHALRVGGRKTSA